MHHPVHYTKQGGRHTQNVASRHPTVSETQQHQHASSMNGHHLARPSNTRASLKGGICGQCRRGASQRKDYGTPVVTSAVAPCSLPRTKALRFTSTPLFFNRAR